MLYSGCMLPTQKKIVVSETCTKTITPGAFKKDANEYAIKKSPKRFKYYGIMSWLISLNIIYPVL